MSSTIPQVIFLAPTLDLTSPSMSVEEDEQGSYDSGSVQLRATRAALSSMAIKNITAERVLAVISQPSEVTADVRNTGRQIFVGDELRVVVAADGTVLAVYPRR